MAQEPAFRGEAVDAVEKALQTFEAILSFESEERFAERGACGVPAFGDLGSLF